MTSGTSSQAPSQASSIRLESAWGGPRCCSASPAPVRRRTCQHTGKARRLWASAPIPACRSPESLGSVDKHANRAARSNGLLQKKLRDRLVAALRVYMFVGEKPPNLPGLALQGGRAEALGGHLREVHMPGLMQAGDHPAKVAALGLAQLLREVLAKRLVHPALYAEAVCRRWLWLISCWVACFYNLQPSAERWAAFSVLNRL